MTLDEAIKHCEEVADSDCYNDKQFKCADEHRQLAEWLKDYKRMKEQEPILDKIRAEIKTKYDSIPWRNNDYDDGWVEALEWVYDDVIDKYKKEK